MELKGKVAIVTGGNQGIGKGIADELSKLGASVVIAARTKKETKHHFVKCDVSKAADVENLINETIKKFNRIDILVNNTGIYRMAKIAEMTEEQWDEMLDTNLKSMFLTTKAVLPHMTKTGSGRIINISSMAGTSIVFEELAHYCASKAGVVGFTKSAALELAPHKITVNAIAPGAIETPNHEPSKDKDALNWWMDRIPLKRIGTPEDVAGIVAYLVSDTASYITGQIITVDGGYSIP